MARYWKFGRLEVGINFNQYIFGIGFYGGVSLFIGPFRITLWRKNND